MSKAIDIFDYWIQPKASIPKENWKKFEQTFNEKYAANRMVVVPYIRFYEDYGLWNYNEDYVLPYEFKQFDCDTVGVEEYKYHKVKKILAGKNLEEHTSKVCSLLQTSENRKKLYEIDNSRIKKVDKFKKQFYALYEMIAYNDIENIKINTNNKSLALDKELSLFLISTFFETLMDSQKTKEVIQSLDEAFNEKKEMYDFDKGFKAVLLTYAAINLLIFIQKETDFIFNRTEEEVKAMSFSDEQFKLIHQLFEVFELYGKEKVLIEYDAVKQLRNRVVRSKINPNVFIKEKIESNKKDDTSETDDLKFTDLYKSWEEDLNKEEINKQNFDNKLKSRLELIIESAMLK